MSAKKKVVFKFDERSYEAGPSELPAGSELAPVSLLGTVWRHKKKGGIYHVTELAPKRGDVYLRAETKGCRSTWKAECLLPFDYEQVPNSVLGDTPAKPKSTNP